MHLLRSVIVMVSLLTDLFKMSLHDDHTGTEKVEKVEVEKVEETKYEEAETKKDEEDTKDETKKDENALIVQLNLPRFL